MDDPSISLLGIYPKNTTIQKDTCIPGFTAEISKGKGRMVIFHALHLLYKASWLKFGIPLRTVTQKAHEIGLPLHHSHT